MGTDSTGLSLSLEERVYNYIILNKLVHPGTTLLVAVSGGQDSVCLLGVLNRIKTRLNINLHIAHLNHRLRGEESDRDALAVKGLADQLGIPVILDTADVFSCKRKHHLSLEEAAREVRYNFLAKTARLVGADRVATGHTQDDNVETILMHLIRGTGTQGLTGLRPLSARQTEEGEIQIIRPILILSREDTLKYCIENNLPVREDSSNLSTRFMRNRVRLELIPLLKNYNPRISDSLIRMSSIVADELNVIENIADAAWHKVTRVIGKSVIFNKQLFSSLEPAIKRRLIIRAIETVRSGFANPLKDIEAENIEDVITRLSLPAGRVLQLPYGLFCIIEYESFVIGDNTAASCPFPSIDGQFELKIPGETHVGQYIFQADLYENNAVISFPNDFIGVFDLAKTGSRLYVRTRLPGDRFQPLGLDGLKKVNEFMIDAHIPRSWRSRIPVVCSDNQVVWVVGYRIDERVKVTEQTKVVLRIECRIQR